MNKEELEQLKEIIIINDEPFYRISNGTSYDYAPIPKQFKPYFEKLQKENKQLKETFDKAIEYINKFEDIKAYYSYEEDGYEEYNYDEDFKIDLLEILEGGD